MNWEDVTFKQYIEITEIQQRNDDLFNKILDTIAVLKDINVNEITINNYKDYTQEITFLNTDIPVAEIKDEYGEYVLQKDLQDMSMQMYIEFQNYAKVQDYVGILSIFLHPKGKQYNEGYNIEKVREYILTMSCVDVISIYAFFLIQSTVSMECLKQSLHQQQQMILREKKQERRKQMTTSAVCQLYWRLLKRQMKHIVRYYRCLLSRFFGYFRTSLKRTKEK